MLSCVTHTVSTPFNVQQRYLPSVLDIAASAISDNRTPSSNAVPEKNLAGERSSVQERGEHGTCRIGGENGALGYSTNKLASRPPDPPETRYPGSHGTNLDMMAPSQASLPQAASMFDGEHAIRRRAPTATGRRRRNGTHVYAILTVQ